ncbi:hypothetical protein MLD38_025400 [Melastoma candidum]|uniref:Uncharacterized protein n=1 Tax=Melastoma candidum TaxID=119954 RepID=A0ACB9P270_9MYRT|nr:hypothetical protein MLD38_025400 [Melastoma candidum]
MADGTRSRVAQMESESMKEVLQELVRNLEELRLKVDTMDARKIGSFEEEQSDARGRRDGRLPWQQERVSRLPRIEFPTFDGSQVQEWVFRCERFFELDETPPELKVSIASVHLLGLAIEWHYAFLRGRELVGPVSWEEYSSAMLLRFGPNELTRPIVLLRELQEKGNLSDYIDEFVSLVTKVDLSIDDQVALFVGGLKRENRRLVTVLKPRTLQQAIALAKTLSHDDEVPQIQAKEVYSRGRMEQGQNSGVVNTVPFGRGLTRPANVKAIEGYSRGGGPIPKPLAYQPPHKRLSTAEMEEKRSKGLCFWCDEKYSFHHKCANRKVYSLILEAGDENSDEKTEPEAEEVLDTDNTPIVTLHAIHGVAMSFRNRTMKIIGRYKKRKLTILVDSGSTHNFLDLGVAKQIGCVVKNTTSKSVMVANGEKMPCSMMVPDFEWEMQGESYVANM